MLKSKTVLVIGGGGREHAIVHQLCKSSQIDKILVTPGNGGIATITSNFNPYEIDISNVHLDMSNISSVVTFAKENNVTVVIVGPEQPLVDGIVDAMTAKVLLIYFRRSF